MAVDVVDDADALFGFDPFVFFGEAGIGANRGDDAVGGGWDVGGSFEKEIQDGAKVPAALGVEAGGASVAIDGAPVEGVINGELAADGLRAVPVDEKLFDSFAVWVIADLAFAAVALESGFGSGDFELGFGAGADSASRLGTANSFAGANRFGGAQRGFGVSCGCGGHLLFLLVRRINRRGVVNEKVTRKWSSDPHRPRVMRSRSRGRRRSVDRGTCGPGIQPRKTTTPGRRRCKEKRKAPSGAPISRGVPESRAVRDPVHVRRHFAREPGDPRFAQGRSGRGTHREV